MIDGSWSGTVEYVGELRSDSDEEDVDPFKYVFPFPSLTKHPHPPSLGRGLHSRWFSMLRLYTHRNYLFGLNDIWVVDGTRAGNDIRFINHGKDGNVEAAGTYRFISCVPPSVDCFFGSDKRSPLFSVILVNGDPRIGIWASTYYSQPFPYYSLI